MAIILDIRGTHGSGKSYVVHELLKRSRIKQLFTKIGDKYKTYGYVLLDSHSIVLGDYGKVCGGCDGIGNAEEIEKRIRASCKKYNHIILEGITVAHTYQRYLDLSGDLQQQGHSYRFLFLDTPKQLCVDRVIARRKARGNNKPLNLYWTEYDWKRIGIRIRGRLAIQGREVYTYDHKDVCYIDQHLQGT